MSNLLKGSKSMTDTMPAKSKTTEPTKKEKDGESTVQDYIGTGSVPTGTDTDPVDPKHK